MEGAAAFLAPLVVGVGGVEFVLILLIIEDRLVAAQRDDHGLLTPALARFRRRFFLVRGFSISLRLLGACFRLVARPTSPTTRTAAAPAPFLFRPFTDPLLVDFRIVLTFEAEAEDVTTDDVVQRLLEAVQVP